MEVVSLSLILAREAEITQLDVLMLVEQDVFELEIAVDTRLLVDIANGTDQLGKGLLDLLDGETAMLEQVIVELVARAVFEDEPDEGLCHDDFVETGDVWVDELAVVVDLAGEVGIVLVGRLEDDLGAIGELVSGEVDLAEGAFSDQTTEGVVADRAQFLVVELVEELLVRLGELCRVLARERDEGMK